MLKKNLANYFEEYLSSHFLKDAENLKSPYAL